MQCSAPQQCTFLNHCATEHWCCSTCEMNNRWFSQTGLFPDISPAVVEFMDISSYSPQVVTLHPIRITVIKLTVGITTTTDATNDTLQRRNINELKLNVTGNSVNQSHVIFRHTHTGKQQIFCIELNGNKALFQEHKLVWKQEPM